MAKGQGEMGEKRGDGARSRFMLMFHTFVMTLCLVGGGILLGVSTWATIGKSNEIFGLNYTGSSFLNTVTRLGVLGIIAGGCLIVFGIFGLLATVRGGCGVCLKVVFGVLSVFLIIALVAVAVATLWFASGTNPRGVENFFRDAWINSVQSSSYVDQVCTIESSFNCRGFDDNACVGCSGNGNCPPDAARQCPDCGSGNPAVTSGCWGEIMSDYRKYYYPVGITSAILAGFLLMDMMTLCAM